MEIYRGEKSYRDDDDDDGEESGSAGSQSRKKKKAQPRPPQNTEGQYFKLDRGKFGEFLLPKQPEWLGPPKSEKKDGEEDDEDKKEKDEEEPEESAEGQEEAESVESAKPAGHQDEKDREHTGPSQTAASRQPEPPRPSQEPLTGPAAEEDRDEFSKIMQREFGGQPLEKAASDELLTDTEPGRPAAVENAVNEQEPVHTEQTYRAEQDQRIEGTAPGYPSGINEAGQPETSPLKTEELIEPAAVRPSADQAPGGTPRYLEHRRSLRETMNSFAIMTIALAGFLANQRRKGEIAKLQKERARDAEKQQEAADRLIADQQAMRQQAAGQEERLAAMQARQQRQAEQTGQQQQQAAAETPAAPLQAPERVVRPTPTPPEAAQPRPAGFAGAAEAAQPKKQEADPTEAARRAVEEARTAEEAEAAKPQQDQLVTQDAWLRHVVDKSGHEVQGAMHHGHEYDAERAQEIQDSRPADVIAGSPQEADRQESNQTVLPETPINPSVWRQPQAAPKHSVLDSGVADSDHSLPPGMPGPSDWQHRLPTGKKHGPVVSALTSPWLFLMLSLILLAYFIASLL